MLPRLSLSLPLLLVLVLAACVADPRDRALTGLDLGDMALVQELGHGLTPADRAAFSTYVVLHVPTGRGFCGAPLLNREGNEPATVGEAIALTLEREAEERELMLAAERPPSAAELARQRMEGLLAQREQLIARKSLLFAEHGRDAENLPEWRKIERELADFDGRLAAVVANAGA